MTYSTQEEREEHAKLARKKSNQKFYDDFKIIRKRIRKDWIKPVRKVWNGTIY